MALEKIQSYLVDYVDEITVHSTKGSRKSYNCPLCGSGTGKNKTGAFSITKDGLRWKCFACNKSGDLLDLIGFVEGVDDFNAQLQRARELFNIPIKLCSESQDSFSQILPRRVENMTGKEKENYTTFYKMAHANISKTDYAQRRGLSDDIINRFEIGYVENWKNPKASERSPESSRLIIPISENSYFARDTRLDIPEIQKSYSKIKVGKSEIFNSKALFENSDTPIFVVEGEIDALSIMEVGGVSVGLGGISNIPKLIDLLDNQPFSHPLLIALDNDKKGKEAQTQLAQQLRRKNIPFNFVNLLDEDIKDPNEMLVKDRKTFSELVKKAIELSTTEPEKNEHLNLSVARHLQKFVDGIADSVNTPCIPTNFIKLDELLDGGLYEGLYVIGAISSLGKTTFVTQIADQIAEQGYDVLIISLEMARNEIIAKSISRNTVKEILDNGGNMRNAKTVRGITTGVRYSKYSDAEQELIKTAIKNYSNYAEHVYVVEGIGDVGVARVRSFVANHRKYTGNTPIIVVDYLQILAPNNERATDKQNIDKDVLELKRISRDFKTSVICISSFNRDNYSNQVGMQSFKESGAIEYSSDVLIGLQFKGVGENGFDINEAKSRNPREVELVILKNRNGKTGTKAAFDYYAMFNYFEERN